MHNGEFCTYKYTAKPSIRNVNERQRSISRSVMMRKAMKSVIGGGSNSLIGAYKDYAKVAVSSLISSSCFASESSHLG